MTRLYAEFAEPVQVVGAIRDVRAWGAPVRFEAYSPYPVPEIERALAAPPSRLPIKVLVVGLVAAAGAYGLQWLLNAYLYPLNVGGRPAHFPLAYVPITFEMGVLFASLTAFVGVLIGGGLLRLWHPVFEVEGIESASGIWFWLEVEVEEPGADLDRLTTLLREAGARTIRRMEVRP